MNNLVKIGNSDLSIKEFNGQRVVTFKDVDSVHERPDGTARKRFNDNRSRFIEGEDFYKICPSEIRTHKIMEISEMAREDVTLLTESGYLMLVKSFTDDLAWEVQRELVKTYFNKKKPMSPVEMMRIQLGIGFAFAVFSNSSCDISDDSFFCLIAGISINCNRVFSFSCFDEC